MKVALVESYNSASHLGTTVEPVIPAGLLSLAAALEEQNSISPAIVPLNLLVQDGTFTKDGDFPRRVAEHLELLDADVVGFQTLCNSYHVAFQIAHEYKALSPRSLIVLGGPQASATDIDTLRSFDDIDIVFRGEAENSLPHVLQCLHDGRDWSAVPGISFRNGAAVKQNPPAELFMNMDDLPQPAYHLYPISSFDSIQLDSARGCPNRCIYCSTSAYFHRRIRAKSPERIVREIEHIYRHFGIRHFHMTHDIFGINRDHAIEFCRLLSDASLDVTWQCMARIDLMDKELLDLMVSSGLTDIYFGIETGSPGVQKYIKKNLNLELARQHMDNVRRRNVNYTCSFVVGFSEETQADLHRTIDMALSFTGANGTIQVNTVKPYAGSEIFNLFRDDLHFNDYSLMLDINIDSDSLQLIKQHPILFSAFYSVPSRCSSNVLNLLQAINSHDVILKAVLSEYDNPLDFFVQWNEWRLEHGMHTPHTYDELGAQCDAFIGHLIHNRYIHCEYLSDLFDFFGTFHNWKKPVLLRDTAPVIQSSFDLADRTCSLIPHVSAHAMIKEFSFDVMALFSAIESDAVPKTFPHGVQRIAFIALQGDDGTNVYARHLDDQSYDVIRKINGSATVDDIVNMLSMKKACIVDILNSLAATYVIEFREAIK